MGTVSRYDLNGWKEDIGRLNTPRVYHACTRFTNNDGAEINLVCGGTDSNDDTTASCEQNIAGTLHWTYTTSLPRPLEGLAGITLDNRVLMMGK